jgi:hypothetical protein
MTPLTLFALLLVIQTLGLTRLAFPLPLDLPLDLPEELLNIRTRSKRHKTRY